MTITGLFKCCQFYLWLWMSLFQGLSHFCLHQAHPESLWEKKKKKWTTGSHPPEILIQQVWNKVHESTFSTSTQVVLIEWYARSFWERQAQLTGATILLMCNHTPSNSACLFIHLVLRVRSYAGDTEMSQMQSDSYFTSFHPHRKRPTWWLAYAIFFNLLLENRTVRQKKQKTDQLYGLIGWASLVAQMVKNLPAMKKA